MLLSIQQRYILDVLKRLGCIRRDQLYTLAGKNLSTPEHEIGPRHVDAMLNQLDHGLSAVRLDDRTVLYGQNAPNADRLEALDVMMELTDGRPLDFQCEQTKEPGGLLLRFTLEGEKKLRLFGVVRYRKDNPLPDSGFHVRQAERVIFLMDDTDLTAIPIIPYKHFFALRQEDGTHRFFSGGNQ